MYWQTTLCWYELFYFVIDMMQGNMIIIMN